MQAPGTTFPIGDTSSDLAVVKGTAQLAVDKTTSTPLAGPGEPIPFELTVRNRGTGAVPDLVVSEPLPAELVFDQSFAGHNNQPFTIESSVPSGTPALPAPTFVAERDPSDPSRITSLKWSFPGFDFLPGSSVKIGFRTTLAPGLAAGKKVENSFGASSADPPTQAALGCEPKSGEVTDGPYGRGRFCTAKAPVTSRGGSALDAQKWVTGDPALGFYNTATDTFVKPGDISCPLLSADGADYTRYPCIALVLAGQHFHFLLNVTNIGNTPATEVRLVDGLPHVGDTGVKLTDQQRDTQWDPRPRLTGSPTLSSGVKSTVEFAYTTKLQACTDELTTPPGTCPAGDWHPGFSTGAEGFRAFVSFPDHLAPGKSFAIRVPMSTPVTLHSPPDAMPVAWNSFAHTDFVLKPGSTTPSQLPLVEPPKVGVALPFGTLEVEKQLTGPEAAQAVGPFEVSYDCTVTPTDGHPESVASGHGGFGVNDPLVVPHVPVGGTCSVWETDTRGGLSDHTTPATAIKTVIKAQKAGNTSVVLVNDFPSPPVIPPPPPGTPPGDADLILTKQVDHASAHVGDPLSYTIAVANAGPATATNLHVSDIPSEALSVLSVSASQGSCLTGRPLVCTLGSLAAGARATITIRASGRSPGLLLNTATATADQTDPTTADNIAGALTQLSLAPARLRITKTPSFRRVNARAAVSYSIHVQALGSVAAIDVRVCDRLARSLTVISAPHAHLAGGQPCWTIPRLDPGHPRVFTVHVVVANVSSPVVARDTASADARNAPTVRARAAVAITPRPITPVFTG